MRWLYQTVTGKSPLQFRFEFALWTREMIRVLLREQFQLKLSRASVGRRLKQLGLTCQRPLFRAMEQDPERVRRWREQEYPAIREQGLRSDDPHPAQGPLPGAVGPGFQGPALLAGFHD